MTSLSETSVLAGSAGQSTGYQIQQSIRFNQSHISHLARTPSSQSNRRTWTFSAWIKFSGTSTNGYHNIFVARQGANDYFELAKEVSLTGNNRLDVVNRVSSTNSLRLTTSRQFRDSSAWYHIMNVCDMTNGREEDRYIFYINGERLDSADYSVYTMPTQNYDTYVNTTNEHEIGAFNSGTGYSMDGYMAEIHFVDGIAYGPENFGEFKEDTDLWIPIQYTGSHGTNGFYIKGQNASALGADSSGNGNNYANTGFQTHDKRSDSPTNNHATFNNLINATPGYANGNIEASFAPASSTKWAKTAMNFTLPNTGTWYWEGQEFNNVINPATGLGIVDSNIERLDDKSVSNRPAENMSTFTGIKVYSGPGQSLATYEWKNGSATSTSGAAILSTSRLGFLWEPENNRFTIYDDGSQYQQFTSINTGNYIFVVGQETGTNLYFRLFVEANDWTETPTGITSANALNTKNIGS